MSVIDIRDSQQMVYIVLGIDINANDHIIAVFRTYDDAKKYCINSLGKDHDYYDLWIEKHPID